MGLTALRRKIRSIPPWTRVEVTWEDIQHHAGEIDGHPDLFVWVSIGFLLPPKKGERRRCVRVAQTVAGQAGSEYGEVTVIPESVVVAVEVLTHEQVADEDEA